MYFTTHQEIKSKQKHLNAFNLILNRVYYIECEKEQPDVVNIHISVCIKISV